MLVILNGGKMIPAPFRKGQTHVAGFAPETHMEKEARLGRLWDRMKLRQGKWNVELRFANPTYIKGLKQQWPTAGEAVGHWSLLGGG